jgi:hypothetical protein
MSDLSGLVPEPAVAAFPCPRCQKPLIDPDGLGWCKSCGYCKSLADSEQSTAVASPGASPNELTATSAAIGQLPIWFWVSLVGVVLIVGLICAVGQFVPLTQFARAVITSAATLVGVAVMLVGQFAALVKIAPEDPTLGFKDGVFPFRLYPLVLKHLPGTSFAIYLGAWGLSAIIAANVFIGGLPHWLTYLPDSQKIQAKEAQKSKAAR